MKEPFRADSHNRDVRMRGFARRNTVREACRWVDEQCAVLGEEDALLSQAAGRVLATDVSSTVNVPGFDRAMMDGYAVCAADVAGATAYNQLSLLIVGEALPGRPFSGELRCGQAVSIMTGAPLPSGADAVLPAEFAERRGERVFSMGDIPPSKHIGLLGEDVAAGEVVLYRGRQLRPQDIGLISSIGQTVVKVIRRPRVAIVSTGNELLPAGDIPHDFRIADANGPMLCALATRDGAHVENIVRVPDNRDEILVALQAEADVILVSGGSSVGAEDHLPALLAEHGELAIHGVAMRPSSPTGIGRLGSRLVFLLPGNPVSCLCAYDFFAGRAIRALGGRCIDWPYRRATATLQRKITSVIGRLDYARVKRATEDVPQGSSHSIPVEPLAIGGASILSSTTWADGFVLVPEDSEGYPAGAQVELFLYD